MYCRKKGSTKAKKSPVGNWLSFFNMGKSSATAKPKLHRHPSEPNEMKTTPLPGAALTLFNTNLYPFPSLVSCLTYRAFLVITVTLYSVLESIT